MKSKAMLIAVVVITIAASVFLMIWQRQDNEQLTVDNGQLEEVVSPGVSDAPEYTQESVVPEQTQAPEVTGPGNRPSPAGSAFSLYINGKTVSVAYGVEESTLDKGPGWLETSAMPGQDGMCLVYGHRNASHLRILETVEAGDGVTVTLPDGAKFTYIVTQVQAFESSDDLKIPTLDGTSIALVTCYPFRYSGAAPGKYLVIGQLDAEASD